MSRPVFSFRPNLKNPEHEKAWRLLMEVPAGQRNQYLVDVILDEYYGAAEPPVRCGESHLSGLTEPLRSL